MTELKNNGVSIYQFPTEARAYTRFKMGGGEKLRA